MTALPFKPRIYQHLIVDHILKRRRCAVFADMGLGKTSAVLLALERLALMETVYPVLVCAPLRVAQSTWPDEVKKWECFNHLRLIPIIGTQLEREAALGQEADIYTINYENLPWLVKRAQRKGWPFRVLVCDELTRLKGFRFRQGTRRARALAQVAHSKVKRFIGLTGTPAPNGLKDLWGQLWFIDAGQRLGRTYSAFCSRWFRPTFDGWGLEPLPYAQAEIQTHIQDVCISLNAATYFDLKEPILNTLYVDLPIGARKIYRDLEKKMFAELQSGEEITAANAAAKTGKCLQAAAGALYLDETGKEWEVIHAAKIKALESIIDEANGASLLVAYHFRSDLARLQKAFPQGRLLDTNPDTLRAWNAGEIPLLFAHPASAGHGLNMQDGGNRIAFFSVNWDLEKHLQILERLGATRQAQSGYDRPTFIHFIIARDTIDELVMERLQTKKTVQDILREAMNHHKEEDLKC